jgi:hypothetical protein
LNANFLNLSLFLLQTSGTLFLVSAMKNCFEIALGTWQGLFGYLGLTTLVILVFQECFALVISGVRSTVLHKK